MYMKIVQVGCDLKGQIEYLSKKYTLGLDEFKIVQKV